MKVITNNREIYEKMNMLHISNKVILKNIKPWRIGKIMKSVNMKDTILKSEQVGNDIIINKVGKMKFDIYWREK